MCCHGRNSRTASLPATERPRRTYKRTAMDVERNRPWTTSRLARQGGLVHQAHDELRDELATLEQQAYLPSAVQLEPPIRNNFDLTTENYSQERGDIGIRGFWAKQFDYIVDI